MYSGLHTYLCDILVCLLMWDLISADWILDISHGSDWLEYLSCSFATLC